MANKSLLDDPVEMVRNTKAALSDVNFLYSLKTQSACKIPRIAPFLVEQPVRNLFSHCVWVLRDPLDVFASIVERYEKYPQTSMKNFPELGIKTDSIENNFSIAFQQYCKVLSRLIDCEKEKVHVVSYESFFNNREKVIEELVVRKLFWPKERSIGRVANFQFGPIRHKSGKQRGLGAGARFASSQDNRPLLAARLDFFEVLQLARSCRCLID